MGIPPSGYVCGAFALTDTERGVHKAPANVVLVDSEKRIRGYYSIGSREEVDRLILELQILLSKY